MDGIAFLNLKPIIFVAIISCGVFFTISTKPSYHALLNLLGALTDKLKPVTSNTRHLKSRQSIDRYLRGEETHADRVRANHRLFDIFRLKNPFTSFDNDWRISFRQDHVQKILDRAPQQWPAMYDRAVMVTEKFCKNYNDRSLVQLVQTTVLISVLPWLFPDDKHYLYNLIQPSGQNSNFLNVDQERDVLDSYNVVAVLINELWIDSKTPYSEHTERKIEDLQKALDKVFNGKYVREGRHNHLNLIIPAYETTWRVAFRIVVEVLFRQRHQGQDCGRLDSQEHWLQVIRNAPTDGNWTGEAMRHREQDNLAVYDIVREGLRLYPPMRSIHRKAPDGQEAKIDVEHMQRAGWKDGDIFRPGRWKGIKKSDEVTSSYRPFGTGQFRCQASKSAAPTLVGVMITAIVRTLEDLDVSVYGNDKESKDAIHEKEPLRHERDSYKNLILHLPSVIRQSNSHKPPIFVHSRVLENEVETKKQKSNLEASQRLDSHSAQFPKPSSTDPEAPATKALGEVRQPQGASEDVKHESDTRVKQQDDKNSSGTSNTGTAAMLSQPIQQDSGSDSHKTPAGHSGRLNSVSHHQMQSLEANNDQPKPLTGPELVKIGQSAPENVAGEPEL